jgi:hypothetical protein
VCLEVGQAVSTRGEGSAHGLSGSRQQRTATGVKQNPSMEWHSVAAAGEQAGRAKPGNAPRTFLTLFACCSVTMLTAKGLPGCSMVSSVRSFLTDTVMPGGSNEACSTQQATKKPTAGQRGRKEAVSLLLLNKRV